MRTKTIKVKTNKNLSGSENFINLDVEPVDNKEYMVSIDEVANSNKKKVVIFVNGGDVTIFAKDKTISFNGMRGSFIAKDGSAVHIDYVSDTLRSVYIFNNNRFIELNVQ